MMWLKNFERVQEIQQQIQWQPVTELEPRAFIPEVIRSAITNSVYRPNCKRGIDHVMYSLWDRFSDL